MGDKVRSMIQAGALRQLCSYFDSIGAKPAMWAEVREYALREFREVTYEDIIELIECCQCSFAEAEKLNAEGG